MHPTPPATLFWARVWLFSGFVLLGAAVVTYLDWIGVAWVRNPVLWLVAVTAGSIGGLGLLWDRPRPDKPAVAASGIGQPRYSKEKVEALRKAATALRDICWGVVVSDADQRLRAFRDVADDFVREPQFDKLLPRIEGGATRLNLMARMPPAGVGAADPIAQNVAMQDAHTALDELFKITDRWVIYEDGATARVWPDFDKWDAKKEFPLWEAAYLWVDEEPRGLPLSVRAEIAFRKLEKAIRDRDLSVRQHDLREVIEDAADLHHRGRVNKANPNWIATRANLLSCAHSLGDKPRFLFPKERT